MKGRTSYFSDKIVRAIRHIRHRLDGSHVHDFRIGVKRLKTLWLFREWVTGKRTTGSVQQHIRKAYKRSGRLRDLQVRQHMVEDQRRHMSAGPGDPIPPALKKAGKPFRAELRDKRMKPAHLMSKIRKWISFIDGMNEEQLMINGESFYLRGMERMHLLANSLDQDKALHQVRKEIKHLIHMGQFLEEVLPGRTPWKERLPILVRVAACIGAWHDLQILPSGLDTDDPLGQPNQDTIIQARTKATREIAELLGLDAE